MEPLTDVLEIDLATWWRGKGGPGSKLCQSNNGHKCCLGFECILRGVPPKDAEVDMPSRLHPSYDSILAGLVEESKFGSRDDTDFSLIASRANDAIIETVVILQPYGPIEGTPAWVPESIAFHTEEERQEFIVKLFMDYLGRTVVFVGKEKP